MSIEELKYFFSYSRKDSEFVLQLAKELREAGANVWVDKLDIRGGQKWDRTIEQALMDCKGMIVILSPEAVASEHVMDELECAQNEGKLVVPVLLRSCRIPLSLRRVQYTDFTADYDTGFSQLLKALAIGQPTEPSESAAAHEPFVQDSTVPLEGEPTGPPVRKEQTAQEVEEPFSPEVSEPVPDDVDHPKPTGLETEKVGELLSPEVSEPVPEEVDHPKPTDLETEKVEELLSPEVAEPVPEEVDHPKPADLETEKEESKRQSTKVLAIMILMLFAIISMVVLLFWLQPETYSPAATAGPNGAIEPNSPAPVASGSNLEFTAFPDTGYQVDKWFVDGNDVQIGGTDYTLSNIQANSTVNVTFRRLEYEVAGTAGPGGSISPSGAISVHHGDDLAFNATPKAGYQVDKWSVDGNDVRTGGTDYTLRNIQANSTVNVTFLMPEYEVTGTAGTGGSISPSGATPVPHGDDLAFNATPKAGYQVDKWSVDGNDVQTGGTGYTLRNIQADHSAKVTFKRLEFEVISAAGPNGAIDPNGSRIVSYDSNLEFTALPNTGYQVDKWFVDGNDVQEGGTVYMLRNIQADHSVKVTFRPLKFEVTSVAGPNGAIDPNGSAIVAFDGNREFMALPDTGYQVDKWSVGDNDVQIGGTGYTLRNIQANSTVNVNFRKLEYEVTGTAGAGGSISPSGATPVTYGDDLAISTTPEAGYEVDKWSVDGNDVQTGGTGYTLRNIRADHSVKVTFKQPPVVNDKPVANDDDVKVVKGDRLNIDVVANDTDSDGTIDQNTVNIIAKPAHGDAFVKGDGTVNYKHDNSKTSSDSFTYTVDDKEGATSNIAKVTITVLYPVRPRPVLPACGRSPYHQGSVSEYMLPYLLLLGVWIIIKRRNASGRNAINKCDKPGVSDIQK